MALLAGHCRSALTEHPGRWRESLVFYAAETAESTFQRVRTRQSTSSSSLSSSHTDGGSTEAAIAASLSPTI